MATDYKLRIKATDQTSGAFKKTNKNKIDNIFIHSIFMKNLCFDWHKLVQKKK